MTNFTVYTPANAPAKSKSFFARWQERLGFTPNVVGVMAESPALLEGYANLGVAFEGGLFSPVERSIINMVPSLLNGSAYCVAAHTALGEKAGVPREILTALREEKPLKDPRLEALRIFVIAAMKKMGRVDARDLDAFYKVGFTKAHVLEVILGLSINLIGNYVNHIAAPVLDKALEPHRIDLSGRPLLAGKSQAA